MGVQVMLPDVADLDIDDFMPLYIGLFPNLKSHATAFFSKSGMNVMPLMIKCLV